MTTSFGVSRQCPRRRDCPVHRSTDTSRAISFRHAVASVLAGSRGWRQRYFLGCRAGRVRARLREIYPDLWPKVSDGVRDFTMSVACAGAITGALPLYPQKLYSRHIYPATDIKSEGRLLGGRRSWDAAPNVVRVEGRSLPSSRSLPKELEGTRCPNSWSDNSCAATQSCAGVFAGSRPRLGKAG